MKSYRKELSFNTPTRMAFVNITSQVQDFIRDSGIKDGLVLANANAHYGFGVHKR